MTTSSRLDGRRIARVLFATVMSLAASGVYATESVDLSDPPAGIFDDHWYACMINDQRAGYSRVAAKRVGEHIESLNFVEMEMQRGPARIKIVMKSKQRETVSGEPVSFEVTQQMSLMSVKKTGVIRDGRVYVTTTQQGQTTKADYAWHPKAKMSWAATLAARAVPQEVGTTLDLWVYDALIRESGPVRTNIRVVGKETIDLLGRKVEAFKTENTTFLGIPITSMSYTDADGNDLKTTMDLGFAKAEIVACTEEFARRKVMPPELFVQTVIEIGRPLDTANLNRIRYRLHVDDEIKEGMFPQTSMQTVVKRTKNDVVLDVQRFDASTLGGRPSKPVPDALRAYLKASTFLNAKDPVIVSLARKAVGSEKDPLKMADLLRRFVTDFVVLKDLSVGLATASEVARSKQGDCTEHAVLLAALARAAGIPARCVGGLVYVSEMIGRKDIFGFHMWTQVWIAGKWVDIDAAFRQTECDPSHIAMMVLALNEDVIADIAVGLIPFITKTRIEILDTKRKGQ